jgi:hypothetical protein
VTTLPKRITAARDVSRKNLLFYLIFSLLTLPKKSAFGKVTWMGKRRLLPQMTASLYLGREGRERGTRRHHRPDPRRWTDVSGWERGAPQEGAEATASGRVLWQAGGGGRRRLRCGAGGARVAGACAHRVGVAPRLSCKCMVPGAMRTAKEIL